MSSAPQLSRDQVPALSWLEKPWIPPALACGLVFLMYAGAVRFQFVYDDQTQIVNNAWLTSIVYLPRYFTSHVWAFAKIGGSYWRPLFLTWLMAHRILFGIEPAMFHLDSILLHVAVTGFVYLVALHILRDRVAGLIAALIFGLHPALIESVAWVSGVTDPLLAICLVPSFLAFLNWRRAPADGPTRRWPHGSTMWLAVSLVLYALGLMSKEPAVVLPVLVFAYAWIYSGESLLRRTRDAVVSVLPYVPVTLAYAAVHLIVLGRTDYSRSLATPLRTVLTAPSLMLFYLRMLVYPAVISPHYNFKLVLSYSFAQVVIPALLLVAIAVLLYAAARRDHDFARLTAFATVWIVLPLLPAFYLAPQGPHDFAHARYLYLSCIGLGLLVAAAIRRLRSPIVQATLAGAIVVLLALGTATQELYWANNMRLFTRGVNVGPDNPTALTGLGVEYGKSERYPEAIALFQRALAIDPNDWHPNFSLGYTYYVLGRYAEAEPLIARAVALNTWGADPDQFAYLGLVEMKLGDLPRAELAVRQAIQRQPQREQFRYALALILEQEGKLADAAHEFQETLAVNPNNADARARLARIQKSLAAGR